MRVPFVVSGYPVWGGLFPESYNLYVSHDYDGYPEDGIEEVVNKELMQFHLEA